MFKEFYATHFQTVTKAEPAEDIRELPQRNPESHRRQLEALSQMDEASLAQHFNLIKTAMKSEATRKMVQEQHGIQMSERELEIMQKMITPDMMKQSLNFIKNQGIGLLSR